VRRNHKDGAAGPVLLTPTEVAKALGCSEWWVKEQARKRRIPFAWIGGSYRFTHEHLAEIICLFEVRPSAGPLPPDAEATGVPRPRPSTVNPPKTRLKARTPRRARRSGSQSPAA
jgi:excisionase family DNA binding protein